jgi:colicin import membrane protein
MKRFVLFIAVCLFSAWAVYAQPGKKPPTPKKVQKEVEKVVKQGQKDMENAAKSNKPPAPPGNAYGKNKGGLEGRDFGQQRAADAKSKQGMQDAVLNNIRTAASIHLQTLEKIMAGLTQLENMLKAGEISDADYKLKKKAFHDLEKQVRELEKRNNELKKKMEP